MEISNATNGSDISLILVVVVLVLIAFNGIKSAYRKAKSNNPENADESIIVEDIKETIINLLTGDRLLVLIQQCVEDALDTLVKGSTKEQLVEQIKENITSSLYNYIENEYPKYTIICTKENIEKLADILLDRFQYTDDKIEELYQKQIDELNVKDEE